MLSFSSSLLFLFYYANLSDTLKYPAVNRLLPMGLNASLRESDSSDFTFFFLLFFSSTSSICFPSLCRNFSL